jgi:hypothetical protein
MTEQQDSPQLTEAKSLLQKENMPPENVIEMFIQKEQLDEIKSNIRKQTNNNCYFFVKEAKENLHLIAFINIEDIGDFFEKLKASFSNSEIDYEIFKQGSAYSVISLFDD